MVDEKFKLLLLKAYQGAGVDFLAYRLESLFVQIETPEDVALHNDVVNEVLAMIEPNSKPFFKALAESILYHKTVPAKKTWLGNVASQILNIAQVKG